MPTFVLTYRSPQSYTPTAETAAEWRSWFEGMGDAVLDIGQPVVGRSALGNCDAASTSLGGYSIITADDLAAALEAAHGCPFLSRDGGVEVGELGPVPAPVTPITTPA